MIFDIIYTHSHLKSNITYGWLALDGIVFIVYAFFGLFGVYKQRLDILLWYFGMSVIYSIVSISFFLSIENKVYISLTYLIIQNY